MKKTALLLAALLFAGSGLAQETKRVNVETRRVDGSSSIGAFSDIPAPGTCPDGYVPYFGGTPPVLICGATVYAPTTKTLSVPYGALQAANVTATALPTPGAITVTPVYTQVASITVVAGASLVDGDGFIVRGTGASVLPLEFDATPGNGTSGGAVPLIFAPGDSATVIRDLVITTINGATATTHVVATAGGAATVSLAIDAPGVAGGANSETVANGGFAITAFANPTAATTVTYYLVGVAPDGSLIGGGPASTTTAATATLSAANHLNLSWTLGTGWASARVYRTVAPTSPNTTGIVYSGTALTVSDTGLAGGGEVLPLKNETGVVGGKAGLRLQTIGAPATGTLAVADVSGTLISNYGQGAENTTTLPAAAAGYNFIAVVGTAGAGAWHIKAGASDKFYLDGTALDDGDKASLAAPAVGNTLTCIAFQTGATAWDWLCTSGGGAAWTDGGA